MALAGGGAVLKAAVERGGVGATVDDEGPAVVLLYEGAELGTRQRRAEVALDDERGAAGEQQLRDVIEQAVAGPADLPRPGAVAPAEAVEEQFLDGVAADQRQGEVERQPPPQRRLAGAGRAGDDNQQ